MPTDFCSGRTGHGSVSYRPGIVNKDETTGRKRANSTHAIRLCLGISDDANTTTDGGDADRS